MSLVFCMLLLEYYDLSDDAIYKKRRQILQDKCLMHQDKIERDFESHKQGKGIFKARGRMKVSDTEKPFIWCQVPKVGGTSWSILFINTWFPEHNSSASLVKAQNFIDKQWGKKSNRRILDSRKSKNIFIFYHSTSIFKNTI